MDRNVRITNMMIYIDHLFQRVVLQAERPYISRDNRLANHHQHRNKARKSDKLASNCDALQLKSRPTSRLQLRVP